MRWVKKGHIFTTENQTSWGWMHSHAQCPTALVLEDRIRIYFSSRLRSGESLPTFLDVDKENPQKILYLNEEPILQKGRLGTFDENGIIPNNLFRCDGKIYLYYAGWSQCKNVPYKNFTGLAISNDDGLTFKKHSEGPVFAMNEFDPLSATGPYVIKKNKGYLALYSTGTHWHEINGHLEHTYLFTSATSADAIHWNPTGKIAIPPKNIFEAHCKPAILFIEGLYHMWYSKRGSHDFRDSGKNSYRLGYACSKDFIHWIRKDDNAGINISLEGWDNKMICYPDAVKVNDKYLLFYNGNGFGRSGFGYAELEL